MGLRWRSYSHEFGQIKRGWINLSNAGYLIIQFDWRTDNRKGVLQHDDFE